MRTLVTGGAGFLGRHLVDALVLRGDRVTVLDRGARSRSDVEHVDGDICDPAIVGRAVAGHDLVIHSASIVHTKWNQLDLIRSVNIGGTENVIAACREAKVRKLVYVSSASIVYEGRDIRFGDEQLPHARRFAAPYAETKSVAERSVLRANGPELATCALRPHSIFGPGDTRLVPAIIEKARKGKLRFAVGKEGKLTDFTYVSNVVDACVSAADRLEPGSPVAGQAYFITNGEPMSFWSFVKQVVEPLGYESAKVFIPYQIAYGAAWVREAIDTLKGGTLNSEESLSRFTIDYLCTDHYYSIAKAKRDLDYRPAVDMKRGIELTVSHLQGPAREAA
jgi:sterol-4alpha-carboxylate 3-dehydrogenase (decarboxylating)